MQKPFQVTIQDVHEILEIPFLLFQVFKNVFLAVLRDDFEEKL